MKKFLVGILTIGVLFAIFIFYSFNKFSSVSAGEKIKEYNSPEKAILVIDIQRAVTDKNSTYGLDKNQGKQMIININKILNDPSISNFKVIYIKQVFKDDFLIKLFTKGMMQKGSIGVQFTPELKIVSKNIFIKHIMDAFSNPKLDKFLIGNKINHLYIAGLDAEACVDKTVKAALNRNYKVSIIKDAIATKSDEKLNNKINEFSKLGADIIFTLDFLKSK